MEISSAMQCRPTFLRFAAGAGTKVQMFGLRTKDEDRKEERKATQPHLRNYRMLGEVSSSLCMSISFNCRHEIALSALLFY